MYKNKKIQKYKAIIFNKIILLAMNAYQKGIDFAIINKLPIIIIN